MSRVMSSRRISVSDEDCVYFLQRAEAETELAQRAEHPKAVAAHFHLAQSYLDLVFGEGSEEVPDCQPN